MRIHVTLPTPTTVSVDDELMALLGAALVVEHPPSHASAKIQIQKARSFVKDIAKGYDTQSSTGLSLAIQRKIFQRISSPNALYILAARDTEEAKEKAAAAHLHECAAKGWLTPAQIEQKRLQKLHNLEWRRGFSAREATRKKNRLLRTG